MPFIPFYVKIYEVILCKYYSRFGFTPLLPPAEISKRLPTIQRIKSEREVRKVENPSVSTTEKTEC